MVQEYPFNNPKHDATIQFGPIVILTHAFCHLKHKQQLYTSIASAAAAAAAIVATSTIAPTAVSTTATAIARVAIAVYRGP
jgi:hypothetical protein